MSKLLGTKQKAFLDFAKNGNPKGVIAQREQIYETAYQAWVKNPKDKILEFWMREYEPNSEHYQLTFRLALSKACIREKYLHLRDIRNELYVFPDNDKAKLIAEEESVENDLIKLCERFQKLK